MKYRDINYVLRKRHDTEPCPPSLMRKLVINNVPCYSSKDANVAFAIYAHNGQGINRLLYAHDGKLYEKRDFYFGWREERSDAMLDEAGFYASDYVKVSTHFVRKDFENRNHPLTDFIYVDGILCERVSEPYYYFLRTNAKLRLLGCHTEHYTRRFIANTGTYRKPRVPEVAFNANELQLALSDPSISLPKDFIITDKDNPQWIEVRMPSMVLLPSHGDDINQ